MVESRELGLLVIDADAASRAESCRILREEDYRVRAADSLAAVLDTGDWSSIFAILLDRHLLDGPAERGLAELKLRAPNAAVIVVTTEAELDGAIAALGEDVEDYLLRPVHASWLRVKLSRLLKRRHLAEHALQTERLAAIGQTVTGLAHESRNAFQRSQACLELLTMELAGQAEQLELVASVRRALDHLHHLYEEVRDYAAPIKLDLHACDLAHLWRTAWDQLEYTRGEKEVRLVEHTQGVDLNVVADWFALGQVFRNVLENAVSACPHRGTIVIHCRHVALPTGRPAVRIAIRDDGPGIAREHRARIFDAFFTTKTQGTGLGMAIARRIVEAHGGRIELGEATAGAEFVLTLAGYPGDPKD